MRVLNAPFARIVRDRGERTLDALLAGRGWIVLVGVLLAGIVFFNVDLLKLNRDIAGTAEQIEQLKRENGRYRERVAQAASSERIQEEAVMQGLVLPQPGDVRYLKAHPSADPLLAARRYTEPSGLVAAPAPVVTSTLAATTTTTDSTAVAADPTAVTSTPDATATGATPSVPTTLPTTASPGTTGTAPTGTTTPDPATTTPAPAGTTSGTAVAPTG